MLKLMNLILENEVDQEEDLGKVHVISERGYQFLKGKIDGLNKKATKWGVPPMVLKVVNEKFEDYYKLSNNTLVKNPAQFNEPDAPKIILKKYEIIIEGEPPSVEGYEFIAKVEHTPEGNILNYAPKASDKHLPQEYRTATQQCDVCKSNRDRNNTFILKLEKDDPQRFADKKAGDFVMVGSGCLKRFLPNISANTLMEYADMIEAIRESIHQADEMEDDFSGGFGASGQGNWIESNHLGLWLSAEYLHTGKYLSKKKAAEFETSSTLDNAFAAMNSRETDKKEDDVHQKMRTDEAFRAKAESFKDEFIKWSKEKDFDTLIVQKPDFADFFHNLKVIAKQDTFKANNAGFFSALFQLFLRDKGELEKQAQLKAARPNLTYIGQPGQKAKATVTVKKIKEYESQYGRGLIVNMEGFANEIDPATGQEVRKDSNLLYFTGTNFELEEGEQAEVEFTVKGHQQNKYTQLPETQITRMKVLKFISKPERNAGKDKIKKLNGKLELINVNESRKWNKDINDYEPNYTINFSFPTPGINSPWGEKAFFVSTIDQDTYNKYKDLPEKTKFDVSFELKRAMNREDFESYIKNGNTMEIVKLKINGITQPEAPTA